MHARQTLESLGKSLRDPYLKARAHQSEARSRRIRGMTAIVDWARSRRRSLGLHHMQVLNPDEWGRPVRIGVRMRWWTWATCGLWYLVSYARLSRQMRRSGVGRGKVRPWLRKLPQSRT